MKKWRFLIIWGNEDWKMSSLSSKMAYILYSKLIGLNQLNNPNSDLRKTLDKIAKFG
jgi:hypothetical protein